MRWPQEGTCPVLFWAGGGTAGLGTVSKASAAVPNLFGIWLWPGPSQLPEHFRVKELCCCGSQLWGTTHCAVLSLVVPLPSASAVEPLQLLFLWLS